MNKTLMAYTLYDACYTIDTINLLLYVIVALSLDVVAERGWLCLSFDILIFLVFFRFDTQIAGLDPLDRKRYFIVSTKLNNAHKNNSQRYRN